MDTSALITVSQFRGTAPVEVHSSGAFMANRDHVAIIRAGVRRWNEWRNLNPKIQPDLSRADLSDETLVDVQDSSKRLSFGEEEARRLIGVGLQGINLYDANLRGATLRKTDLRNAFMVGADVSEADLSGAGLISAHCRGTTFRSSKLVGASLRASDFRAACLEDADLSGADLTAATFVDTDLTGASLTGAQVYGLSAWNLLLTGTKQSDLIITKSDESRITVDDVKLAQFTYLLLDNPQLRDVIDTIGKKGVLILGRFTEERKAVLDAIRAKLRQLDWVPMMFDFAKPTQRDFTETIKILAGLSRFIIADITNPKSSPLELQATMPDYMIPFVPIIQAHEKPFSMFQDLKQKYGEWVLDPLEYDTAQGLLDVFEDAVVAPAIEMATGLERTKAMGIRTRHVEDYKKARLIKEAEDKQSKR